MVSPINIPNLLTDDESYFRKYVRFVTKSTTALAHPIYITTEAQLCVGVQSLVRLVHTYGYFGTSCGLGVNTRFN